MVSVITFLSIWRYFCYLGKKNPKNLTLNKCTLKKKQKKKPDNLEDEDTLNFFLQTSLKVVTLDVFPDDFLVSCILFSNRLVHMDTTRRLSLGF